MRVWLVGELNGENIIDIIIIEMHIYIKRYISLVERLKDRNA